jgi:hypothetical protein
MRKVTARAIYGVHNFKASKNIAIVRPGDDNKFVTQFNNIFLILNERGEVSD